MTKLQQAIERAMQALEELENALNEDNQRKVGAALYELCRALKEAHSEAQQSSSRQ